MGFMGFLLPEEEGLGEMQVPGTAPCWAEGHCPSFAVKIHISKIHLIVESQHSPPDSV